MSDSTQTITQALHISCFYRSHLPVSVIERNVMTCRDAAASEHPLQRLVCLSINQSFPIEGER